MPVGSGPSVLSPRSWLRPRRSRDPNVRTAPHHVDATIVRGQTRTIGVDPLNVTPPDPTGPLRAVHGAGTDPTGGRLPPAYFDARTHRTSVLFRRVPRRAAVLFGCLRALGRSPDPRGRARAGAGGPAGLDRVLPRRWRAAGGCRHADPPGRRRGLAGPLGTKVEWRDPP